MHTHTHTHTHLLLLLLLLSLLFVTLKTWESLIIQWLWKCIWKNNAVFPHSLSLSLLGEERERKGKKQVLKLESKLIPSKAHTHTHKNVFWQSCFSKPKSHTLQPQHTHTNTTKKMKTIFFLQKRYGSFQIVREFVWGLKEWCVCMYVFFIYLKKSHIHNWFLRRITATFSTGVEFFGLGYKGFFCLLCMVSTLVFFF